MKYTVAIGLLFAGVTILYVFTSNPNALWASGFTFGLTVASFIDANKR